MEFLTAAIIVVIGYAALSVAAKYLKIDKGSVLTAALLLPAIAWLFASNSISEFTTGNLSVKFREAGLKKVEGVAVKGQLADLQLSEPRLEDVQIWEDFLAAREFTSFKETTGGSVDLWVYLDNVTDRKPIQKWLSTTFTNRYIAAAEFKTLIKGIVKLPSPSPFGKFQFNPVSHTSIRYVIFGYRDGRIEFYVKYSDLLETDRAPPTNLSEKEIFMLANSWSEGAFDKARELSFSIVPIKESDDILSVLNSMSEIGTDQFIVVDKRKRYIGTVRREQIVTHLLTVLAGN